MSTKILLVPPKCEIILGVWVHFFLYCDIKNWSFLYCILLSIVSLFFQLVIVFILFFFAYFSLSVLYIHWFVTSFLYILYSYRSYLLLRAIAKSKWNPIAIARKGKYCYRNIKKICKKVFLIFSFPIKFLITNIIILKKYNFSG